MSAKASDSQNSPKSFASNDRCFCTDNDNFFVFFFFLNLWKFTQGVDYFAFFLKNGGVFCDGALRPGLLRWGLG